ncbi:MAG TPA: hypothetical protein ENK18_09090 [Deltaproteobacteria bacterium]|nr:hypothetical protein [Deltaproteobacteria bacterium]
MGNSLWTHLDRQRTANGERRTANGERRTANGGGAASAAWVLLWSPGSRRQLTPADKTPHRCVRLHPRFGPTPTRGLQPTAETITLDPGADPLQPEPIQALQEVWPQLRSPLWLQIATP